ncbi:S-methyl-5-thioribose-1-phosphate isomerase [Paenibacillus sp. chi10]|uniref:Methylthioribose-1-phosphate isomerase n=1 Tax=Paenibacillus suaedae TaxID=3077233 RepID=A0AAJ2N343_9BACL|nr:S-methyl-5-thioribose-1-phosphate isomerase [Paenibacillus sp. chi10]MDT8975867.1 S-methyl-5-thioribose-1-phosphate isomerase [Paenibacillus sp. chi10]
MSQMNSGQTVSMISSVRLEDEKNTLIILDQTRLPNETVYLELQKLEDIWDAIYHLKVRGAPAIGIAAAFGVYLGVKGSSADTYEEFFADFGKAKQYLGSSRPTAVNLFWALNRMEARMEQVQDRSVAEIKAALKEEAEAIRAEDEQVCESIGRYALSLLQPNWGILTHCNAGAIATAKYGTALAPIHLGQEQGYQFKVYADETRPLLQGARLTAWELKEAGVDVTLICDNMASIVMKEGKIQAVLVGCDRVAANGDAANKIGTSGVAILAKHYGIPFYVCAPLSTVDLECQTGDDIHIELRPDSEVTSKWYEQPMAPEGVKVYNPSFDVTDHSLITAIVTQHGIAYPPFADSLSEMFRKEAASKKG